MDHRDSGHPRWYSYNRWEVVCRHPAGSSPVTSVTLVAVRRDADPVATLAGRGDGGAAEDGVAVVEDRGLAFGDAAGGLAQPDPEGVALRPGLRGVDGAVGAQLGQAVERARRRAAAAPD